MVHPVEIKLTGKVFIKYIDDIIAPKLGDIMLLLNYDAKSPIAWDYENTKVSGYIKAKIFDGVNWQNMDISEFCTGRENKFTKRQRAIDSANLCRDIIKQSIGSIMNKTYRGHYTLKD